MASLEISTKPDHIPQIKATSEKISRAKATPFTWRNITQYSPGDLVSVSGQIVRIVSIDHHKIACEDPETHKQLVFRHPDGVTQEEIVMISADRRAGMEIAAIMKKYDLSHSAAQRILFCWSPKNIEFLRQNVGKGLDWLEQNMAQTRKAIVEQIKKLGLAEPRCPIIEPIKGMSMVDAGTIGEIKKLAEKYLERPEEPTPEKPPQKSLEPAQPLAMIEIPRETLITCHMLINYMLRFEGMPKTTIRGVDQEITKLLR